MIDETDKTLIFGATGLVGSHLAEYFKSNNLEVLTPTRQTVDLTRPANVHNYLNSLPFKPSRIVYAAGYVLPEKAQESPALAWILNSEVVTRIAEWSNKRGLPFCYYSTDYVFDGTQIERPYRETDQASPINSGVYGQSKKAGEVATLYADRNVVLRVMLPYTPYYEVKGDLPRSLIKTVDAGKIWNATKDQMINPIHIKSLVEATLAVIKGGATGIYHLGATSYVSPYEFSVKVADRLDLNRDLIVPTTFGEFSATRPAPRPQNSWIDTGKFRSDFGDGILLGIDESLDLFSREYRAL